MRWEELSGEEFENAVRLCKGVCMVPVSVLEYHGPHLPLGTDLLRAHHMARDVSRKEPVIVFPIMPFTVNTECKLQPGAVVIRDRLLFELLENFCDEIARNGLTKILLLSGHGGNKWFLPLFVQLMLDKNKSFVPYYLNNRGVDPEAVGVYLDIEVFRSIFETQDYGHADELESSELLHIRPDLVHMERIQGQAWPPQDRLSHLPNCYTPVDWFARQPELSRGDPNPATAEKGRGFWEYEVQKLVDLVRATGWRHGSIASSIRMYRGPEAGS